VRNEFRIPLNTRTYADTLLALGLAETLHRLDLGEIIIKSDLGTYLVESETVVQDMSQKTYIPLFDTIRAPKEQDLGQTRDYEQLKADRERFFKLPKELRKPNHIPDGYFPPAPDYSLMSSLVDLLKPLAMSSYSKTAKILQQGQFGLYLETALKAFSEFQEQPIQAVSWLKKQVGKQKIELQTSAVMIFNPMSGKGMNAAKPDSIGMGSLDSPIAFEMLKYSGWWLGAVAATPRNSKDLKVLVISPQNITRTDLRGVIQAFRSQFYSYGAVQIDILAALGLSEVLLKYHDTQEKFFANPKQVIDGFHTAYFQNLGSSKGVSNLSFIGLPAWVNAEDDNDRQVWLTVLKEHKDILSRLDESRSEAHSVLEIYRAFLSLNAIGHFLEFLVDYGVYALGQADRGKPIGWFRTDLLWRVFMGLDNGASKLSTILENTGFQNIAGAIRRSTRGALYAKKRGDKTYEVRYGLAQELKRKAMYKNEFATALAAFVSEYMTENLRAAERGKRQRPAVTTTDLEQVIALMDSENLDSETVAMLLIAYGYAKEPTDPANAKEDDLPEANLENIDGDDTNEEII
jgi:hypothetical protein